MAKKRRARARPETHRICNLEPSHNTEKDWGFEQAVAASAVAVPRAAAPASVDLRASWWDIGNQESTGSCVGWSSTDGVARYHFVKAGRLAQNAKLSPRYTWMSSKETDTFTSRPGRHHPQGGDGHPAQVRGCPGNPSALPHRDQHVPGGRGHLLRHRSDAAHRLLLQPPEELGGLAFLARRPRPAPGWAQRRRDVG